MEVVIRRAEPSDIPEIRSVATAAWHAAHAPIIGPEAVEEFLADHYEPTSFQRWIEREDVVLDVATTPESAVIGYVLALPVNEETSTFSLTQIYIHPDHWGNGIGTRLLDRCEAAIQSRGGERIKLSVMADNERAIGFYEAAGYERVESFYDDRIETYSYTYAKSIG
ncbi:MAG: GNAT family N-acetyltransferase [Halobacteriales archaeon]